jgi:hypothetical protein
MIKTGIPKVGMFKGWILEFIGYSFEQKGIIYKPNELPWDNVNSKYVNFKNPTPNWNNTSYPLCYLAKNVDLPDKDESKVLNNLNNKVEILNDHKFLSYLPDSVDSKFHSNMDDAIKNSVEQITPNEDVYIYKLVKVIKSSVNKVVHDIN